MVFIMKTKQEDISKVLRDYLEQVPFLEVKSIKTNTASMDLSVSLSVQNRSFRLLVQCKNNGQPRFARLAVYKLKDDLSKTDNSYGVFCAPYVSPQSASICQEAGIGYFDLAGNCYLSFDTIYIRKEGYPNPDNEKRYIRSMYSPKAERILRVLLTTPKKSWKTQELAQAAQVSLGQVANVKKLLLDREWLESDANGIQLSNPSALLDEWVNNFDFSRNQINEYFTLADISEAEYQLNDACEKLDFSYALTGFSAANRIAPMVRYTRMSAYLDGDAESLASTLGWKSVTSGANIALLVPYDEGIFYRAQNVGNLQVASLVQIYLDLQSSRGRGQEAAVAIRKEIEKTW